MSGIEINPIVPPADETTISRSSGSLAIKSKTQGDILYFGASGAPSYLNAGTSGQFLKTLGAGQNPTWAAANITSLGSGAITITGNGGSTNQEVGTFSTTGDIGNGTIYVEIFSVGDTTDDQSKFSLANATADTGLDSGANLTDAKGWTKFTVMKGSNNTSNVDALVEQRTGATTTFTQLMDNAEFNVGVAEDFFINLNTLNATATKVRWNAYLVGA